MCVYVCKQLDTDTLPLCGCRLKAAQEKAPAEFKALYECMDYYRFAAACVMHYLLALIWL